MRKEYHLDDIHGNWSSIYSLLGHWMEMVVVYDDENRRVENFAISATFCDEALSFCFGGYDRYVWLGLQYDN